MGKPRLAFISQFGQPGTYRTEPWARIAGRDDDTKSFGLLLESLGLLDRLEYRGIQAHRGDALPADLDSLDAVVLGGSLASVRANHDWQQAILSWLSAWRETGKPLFGICGGHQLITLALGGTVGRVPGGPEVGCFPVTLTEAGRAHVLFDGFDETSPFFFGNFDRAEGLTPGAALLGYRERVPAAAVDHGGNWVSVQFHPEASADWMATCWIDQDAAMMDRYRYIPGCDRMVANFLVGGGVV
jgi:GMP synthase-like glutamine amidotransferase